MLQPIKYIFLGKIWSSTAPSEHVYHNMFDCGTHFFSGLFKLGCLTWERQFTATLTKTTLKYDSRSKAIEKIEQIKGSSVFNCPWVNMKDKDGYTRKFKNFCQTPISVVRLLSIFDVY